MDGVRTAIGRMGCSLLNFRAEDLAAIAIDGLVKKTKISPEEIEDVIMGIAISWHSAVNLSRWAIASSASAEGRVGFELMDWSNTK